MFGQIIPISDSFFSFDGEPIDECAVCSRPLLRPGVRYLIEKAYVGSEPIFEYAMCFDCQESMSSDISRESMQRVEAHFEERVDIEQRRRRLPPPTGKDPTPWLTECFLTKKHQQNCRSYAIYAHCEGSLMQLGDLPLMLSDQGMADLERLLSKKTRESLDDFIDQYLGMPPELKDDPTTPSLLLM